jgi:hypothetical protein
VSERRPTDAELDAAVRELTDDELRRVVADESELARWFRPHAMRIRMAGEILRLREALRKIGGVDVGSTAATFYRPDASEIARKALETPNG